MLNLRRKHVEPASESREVPRIEFHLPATIIGIDAKASIVDFSIGGFYIETDPRKMPGRGQRVNIALKFPNESTGITIKAEVVYRTTDGFGCKLCDPNEETLQVLERCFNIFSGTLPVCVSSDVECRVYAA